MTDASVPTIIVHLDVDAFYVCCERELRPELQNRAVVVSQYNPFGDLSDCGINDPARILYDGKSSSSRGKHQNPNSNGSLIAVSYEARNANVKRNDRGLEAINKCPDDLVIVEVPKKNGKASLSIYRDASERVMSALADFMKKAALELYQELLQNKSIRNNETATAMSTAVSKSLNDIKVEKASIDEIYIDISVPLQTIMEKCRATANWGDLYAILLGPNSASSNTTIGGKETSEAALATNSLSKDDIRKGSSLQVLDSNDAAANVEDTSGKAWWARKFPQAWSKEEMYLAVGSLLTLRARQAIVEKFKGIYTFSAGVSTNKAMSKLASGLKKPNRQTLINPCDETTLQKLFHPLPLGRIRGLGGKFGDKVEETLQIKTVGELAEIPLCMLKEHFDEKQASFLFRTAQGLCDEAVTERTKSKRVGAGKTFRGVLSIRSTDHEKLHKWISNLATEVVERTSTDTTRYAKTLTCWLNMEFVGGGKENRRRVSQSAPIPRNTNETKCTDVAFQLAREIVDTAIRKNKKDKALLIIGMEISATNFVEQGSNSLRDAFQRGQCPKQASLPSSPSSQQIKHTTIRSTTQKTPKGIAAFLRTTKTEADANLDKPEPFVQSSAKKELLSSFKSEDVAVGDISVGSDADLKVAQLLQQQYSHEGGSHADNLQPDTENSLGQVDDEPDVKADDDMEYAKLLQASFDRENEVIASIEHRRASVSSTPKPSVHREGKRKGASISSFFKKKRT
jgi:nucleotidyltransferase/DNA polymerase involved in DNA repair